MRCVGIGNIDNTQSTSFTFLLSETRFPQNCGAGIILAVKDVFLRDLEPMLVGSMVADRIIDDYATNGEQEWSDIYVVFTMILCALKLQASLITLLFDLMWISDAI